VAHRIIRLEAVIDDDLVNRVVAELLFLESEDPTRDIALYINTPGGSVTGAFAIEETMASIRPDVSTLCTGQAAGAALLLLAAGARGKRFALQDATLQFSALQPGRSSATDQELGTEHREFERLTETFFAKFSRHTGRGSPLLRAASAAGEVVSPGAAVALGLIDTVAERRPGALKPLLPGARAAALPRIHVELEQAFERAGDSEAEPAAEVLADWLQSEGDTRGELAALLQRGRAEEAGEYLRHHAVALLGELDAALAAGAIHSLEWRHGFLGGVGLRALPLSHDLPPVSLVRLTRDVLALPLARFVTGLRFSDNGGDGGANWDDTLLAVAESVRGPFVRELHFGDPASEARGRWCSSFGDLSAMWPRLPALEALRIRATHGVLGRIELPSLRCFIRESNALSVGELDSILTARWPRLERLEIWFGPGASEYSGDAIRQLVSGAAPESLRHLGLVDAGLVGGVLPMVLSGSLLSRLDVLDLTGGTLTDDDGWRLISEADRLKHLRRLDLSDNRLRASVGPLRTALPNVVVDRQRA
jgi:ATP-dependent Clp endopeptidase proteolytic subunit ClpP